MEFEAQLPSDALHDTTRNLMRFFHADAGMLVALGSANNPSIPLVTIGYSEESIEALAVQYPQIYTNSVQTQIHGGVDPRVYTIGDQPPSSMPFRESMIYRSALGAQGFEDGLTIQVRHGEMHIGYAHFSSVREHVYDENLQRYGLAMSSVISGTIVECLPLAGKGSLIVETDATVTRLPGVLSIRHDDLDLRSVVLAFLRWTSERMVSFLWVDKRVTTKIVVERLPKQQGARVFATMIEPPYGLTGAELRVLTGVVVHTSNEAVAAAVGTSVRTVHTHINNVLRKLNCSNRTEAVITAIKERLLFPDSEMMLMLAPWALS